jgi:hypothetical protein
LPLQRFTGRAHAAHDRLQPLSWGLVPYDVYGHPEPTIPGLPHLVRCAYRFFQPHSALLLRTPSGHFQPVTSMGFSLQSLSPATSPDTLSGPHAFLPLARIHGPASRPSASCRSATPRCPIKAPKSTWLSWALPSPGASPFTARPHWRRGLPLMGFSRTSSLSWPRMPSRVLMR